MEREPVKRRYESPKRRRQAEETRRRLVESARRLFGERGYATTTIEAVAAGAGVSVQTFYAVLGSKRAALDAVLDALPVAAEPAALRAALAAATGDPREQLRLEVDFVARLFGAGFDVVEIVATAAAAEPELAIVYRRGEERRRRRQRPLVREWAVSGALVPDEREAADVLWAATSPDVYRLLVRERRWSRARYRARLTDSLARLLFRS